MTVRDVKKFFRQVIEDYSDWDPYELRRLFTEAIRDWEVEQGWSEGQKGGPWTDDELRAVLSDAPTKGKLSKTRPGLSPGIWSSGTDLSLGCDTWNGNRAQAS